MLSFGSFVIITVTAVLALPQALAASCPNAKIEANAFSTSDLVANSTVVVNIDIRCDKLDKEYLVYGVLEPSKILLVAARVDEKLSANVHRFQMSFVDHEDKVLSASEQNTVRIYDDQGYAAYRKAIRDEQDTSAIRTLVTVPITKPVRPSRIARLVSCEHCALLAGVIATYVLYSLKSKLVN